MQFILKFIITTTLLLSMSTISLYALTQTQVSYLYASLMGRASEAKGSHYWQNNYTDMEVAAERMLGSAAVAAYFGTALDDDEDFIKKIYANTLNKTEDGANGSIADPNGIRYWTGRLNGTTGPILTRAQMMTKFINRVIQINEESPTPASIQYQNRVLVSNYTADTLEEAPANYAISLAFRNSGSTGLVVTDDGDTANVAKVLVEHIVSGIECAQVITYASNPTTGVCTEFSTPCRVPEGWSACNCTYNVALDGWYSSLIQCVSE